MIRFSAEDLRLFSEVSGDRNPLHLSDAYAARTAYGQRVVFGVLGAIACLGQMDLKAGTRLRHIDAEFRRPLFCGVDYRCEVGERKARLFDGSSQVLALSVVTVEGAAEEFTVDGPAGAGSFTPKARPASEIVPGLSVSGEYTANRALLGALAGRWRVRLAVDLLEQLALASYLVGMELPGETALFFRLVLDFAEGEIRTASALRYRAAVMAVNNRLGHARMSLEIAADGRTLASGECQAFIRELPVEPEKPRILSDLLSGRTAAIIGASRGLGAAIRHAFADRGAAVYGLSRSGSDVAGDGADPEALQRLRERILAGSGRLDFLVCNACPPIVPLRLEPNALERLDHYIQRAVSLTLGPLCALLDLLSASSGTLIVISSAAVANPVREWPHYIAAKQAVEALARTAPLQYPAIAALIVRPEKLMTELVGTPVGRLGAASPAELAARIAEFCAAGDLKPGAVDMLA